MKIVILNLLLVFSFTVSAGIGPVDGPISSGGGGTTSPNKVDPQVIVSLISTESGLALKAFFNSQKNKYETFSEEEKVESLYYKLFKDKLDIFRVLDTTTVDLEMSKPCFDFDGVAKEGSVNAEAGHICISPFLMAKKLDKYNVSVETLGLVGHELSHLLGTTEEEAVLIQKEIVDVYYGIDLAKNRKTFSDNAQRGLNTFLFSIQLSKAPSKWTTQYFSHLQSSTNQYRDIFDENPSILFMNGDERWSLLSIVYSRTRNIYNFYCAQDTGLSEHERVICREELNVCFNGKNQVTAFECYNNQGSNHKIEDMFKTFSFERPRDEASISRELDLIESQVKKAWDNTQELLKFQFQTKINL